MSNFNIDPHFSVYQLVQRTWRDSSQIHQRKTMSVISNEVENATIMDGAQNIVFSSFQRMSRFIPQIPRYCKLAERARHVYVFGEMDTALPVIDNITYVPLDPNDQLAKEWFIVSYGHNYFSALSTEELSHIDDPDHQRLFRGVWTFDLAMVGILNQWLSGIVGMRFEERMLDEHDFATQSGMMLNTIKRLNHRMTTRPNSHPVYGELQTIVEQSLAPVMQQMRSHQPETLVTSDHHLTS